MDYTKDFEDLCEVVGEQIRDLSRKIKNSGMTNSDLEQMDKLTHTLKSIKAVMGMEEGYSNHYPYLGGYGYDGGSSYRDGGSYARVRNQRRDSMGRYSSERGYSRNDLTDKMRELMEDAPDERTRQEIQRMVEKLERT